MLYNNLIFDVLINVVLYFYTLATRFRCFFNGWSHFGHKKSCICNVETMIYFRIFVNLWWYLWRAMNKWSNKYLRNPWPWLNGYDIGSWSKSPRFHPQWPQIGVWTRDLGFDCELRLTRILTDLPRFGVGVKKKKKWGLCNGSWIND